ncbi:MAG: hypothetical protein K2J27_06035 [Duncaniella sp.]|nr:hypothetical protein [Duncaniella sp.]
MTYLNTNYSPLIKGEVTIIHDELEKFHNEFYIGNLNADTLLESIRPHLASIEQKIGKNSIEYIRITTEIVNVISKSVLAYTNSIFSNKIIDKLSASETVKFYSNQRNDLLEAFKIYRKLDNLNMDYAYRIREFNKTKREIENRCHEKGIDVRTYAQKSIDNLKTVGTVAGGVAMETAGCAIEMVIKIALVLAIFFILMAILGVK